MTVLWKMTQEEYPTYRETFIEDYSHEVALNYGYPIEIATELAKVEINGRFESKVH